MFDKITSAAEKLATNVSDSRRGFLVRMGQAALGVAGVVGGLLALPKEALAHGFTNNCVQDGVYLTGFCIDNRRGTCVLCYSSQCPAGLRAPPSATHVCGMNIDVFRTCTCFR
jgi:hypothetical protein